MNEKIYSNEYLNIKYIKYLLFTLEFKFIV